QIERIGVETFGRLALGTLDLGFFHRWRDRPDNALSHLVLQIEDVAETTIKPVCPKMCPGGGIDELSRDAHPVCRFAKLCAKQIVLPVLITSGSTASHCPTCAVPMKSTASP